jgi:adenine-specific DNA-methyltransferase
MNMMYPRLYLARNLLRDDGSIFITIGENEIENLRRLMTEIFGEENFVACAVWQKKYAVSNDDPGIASMHDYIVVYQKSESFSRNLLPRTDKQLNRYTNLDNDPRGVWSSDNYISNKSKEERPTLWYPIKHPNTGEDVWPDESAVWRYSREKHEQMVIENRLYWGPEQTYKRPRLKRFLAEVQAGVVPSTWWTFDEVGHNDEGQKETADLIGPKVFSTPKPVRLTKRIIEMGSDHGDLVLDFFAGSGAFGHAVVETQAGQESYRHYILVQLPARTQREDLPLISDITKLRMSRLAAKIQSDGPPAELFPSKPIDAGFRVYKLAESNFLTWNATVDHNKDKVAKQLELHIDHVREDRTSEDILYELLLKSGYPLATPVETLDLAGKSVYSVSRGALVICLEKELSLELIRAIANLQPERVVCLDDGFAGNDQLKANTVQTFKTKGVVSFKTV